MHNQTLAMTDALRDLLTWLEREGDGAALADWYLDGHCGGTHSLAWRNADRVVSAAERRGYVDLSGPWPRLTDAGRRALGTS